MLPQYENGLFLPGDTSLQVHIFMVLLKKQIKTFTKFCFASHAGKLRASLSCLIVVVFIVLFFEETG